MAVYTDVSDEELVAFLEAYDIGRPVACKGIAEGVENSNFLLQTDQGIYILTIYEKRVAEADLPFFLGLIGHLSTKGVACPLPVTARDGVALRRLAGKPAAIVTFLQGNWPRRQTANHCEQVGAALAEMHLASADFEIRRANALGLEGWAGLIAETAYRADEVRPGLRDEIVGEFEVLQNAWPEDLPSGVIHADLFPDNVFFLGDDFSGLIDFYFACNDAFAYDIAICLNAWCFENNVDFNITKARRLLAGYRRVRELEPRELAALPILAQGAALRFLLTRLYDWLNQVEGALVKPKHPIDYLTRLRFHRQVSGPGAYGLD